ncbi:MAG: hypothetical protein WC712_05340 [Candidatus Brocadiia bacterium]
MQKLCVACCALILLVASVACSGGSGTSSSTSSGSSWNVNSVNGNISGSYTLVYDDNGYVTEVHYNFKPSVVRFDADGGVYSDGQNIGACRADTIALKLEGAVRDFAVIRLENGALRLVSADADFPSIIAIPASISAP